MRGGRVGRQVVDPGLGEPGARRRQPAQVGEKLGPPFQVVVAHGVQHEHGDHGRLPRIVAVHERLSHRSARRAGPRGKPQQIGHGRSDVLVGRRPPVGAGPEETLAVEEEQEVAVERPRPPVHVAVALAPIRDDRVPSRDHRDVSHASREPAAGQRLDDLLAADLRATPGLVARAPARRGRGPAAPAEEGGPGQRDHAGPSPPQGTTIAAIDCIPATGSRRPAPVS